MVAWKYRVKKANAKRRGHEFTITLEYFRDLVKANPHYLEQTDNVKKKWTIDRIDSSKGYIPGNIQILSFSQNSSKKNRDEECPF